MIATSLKNTDVLSAFLFAFNFTSGEKVLETIISTLLIIYALYGVYLIFKQWSKGIDRHKLLFKVTRAELLYTLIGFGLCLLHQLIRPTSLFLVGLFGLGLAYNAILLMIKIYKEGKQL